jgi:glycolate oxidase FAD binding subunit
MSAPILTPTSVAELVDAVRSAPRVVAVGAGTKPALAPVADAFRRIATTRLRGIIEYEPSEFTFTALAGTPVSEISAVLAAQGQYLPFDPVLGEAGSTLGGALAAGVSGPGRFRFGGLRDFVLGVRFVDGEGRLLRLGGKVVKNAAGFDVPKFFVGSAGRFGVFAELTFKVFPLPRARCTLRLEAPDAATRMRLLAELARGRWEIDALESPVAEPVVYARLAGPEAAIKGLAQEILRTRPGMVLEANEAEAFWRGAVAFSWTHPQGSLTKVSIVPSQGADFLRSLRSVADARGWLGHGGNVAYVSTPDSGQSTAWPWPAVTLRGARAQWRGDGAITPIMTAVKAAFDPHGRFPALND